MKRLRLICVLLVTGTLFLISTLAAQDPPATTSQVKQPPALTQAQARQKLFYGYVPPLPIQHTWPGGYRVIMHELFNTLGEHMVGQY
jgi:hypothetical protein